MQKHLAATLCLAALTACSSHYGNYAKVSDTLNAQMADDSASELATLYPPAITHLMVSPSGKDAYGVELVKKLRENGYALEEGGSISSLIATPTSTAATANSKPDWSKNHKDAEPSAPVPAIKAADSASAQASNRSLFYIVDQLDVGLYRITLDIDSHVLSRVYKLEGNGVAPAGSWTLKE